MSDFLDRLLDTGENVAVKLANRAIYGQEDAVRLELAKERDYWSGVNGAGPNDRTGALADASRGSIVTKDPFSGAANPSPIMSKAQVLAVVLLGGFVFWFAFKGLARR